MNNPCNELSELSKNIDLNSLTDEEFEKQMLESFSDELLHALENIFYDLFINDLTSLEDRVISILKSININSSFHANISLFTDMMNSNKKAFHLPKIISTNGSNNSDIIYESCGAFGSVFSMFSKADNKQLKVLEKKLKIKLYYHFFLIRKYYQDRYNEKYQKKLDLFLNDKIFSRNDPKSRTTTISLFFIKYLGIKDYSDIVVFEKNIDKYEALRRNQQL
jgi:hypothetical protein